MWNLQKTCLGQKFMLIYLSGGNNVREIDGQLETNYVAQIVAAPLMSAAAYFLEQGVFTGEPL